MKLKNPENEKYIKAGLAFFTAFSAVVVVFFAFYRKDGIISAFHMVNGILKPFIYGAVFAYILAPMCNKLDGIFEKRPSKRRHKRGVHGLSIFISMACTLALITALMFIIIPRMSESISTIAETAPGKIEEFSNWLEKYLADNPDYVHYWNQIYDRISQKLQSWFGSDMIATLQTVGTVTLSHVKSIMVFFKNILLGLLISAYFLGSRKLFASQARLLLYGIFRPKAAAFIEKEALYADRMFNGFLIGKIKDSAIIGVLCFIGCQIMGFESAVLISVIVGVTNIIPFFGPFIGAIPCIFLLLIDNPVYALYFMIFILILQQLDGNLIGPKIMGDTTGLSSFWVLFSIMFFGGLWGVTGMVVGVPLFAVIYDIVRQLTRYGLGRHGKAELADAYNAEFHPEEKQSSEGA